MHAAAQHAARVYTVSLGRAGHQPCLEERRTQFFLGILRTRLTVVRPLVQVGAESADGQCAVPWTAQWPAVGGLWMPAIQQDELLAGENRN